MNLDELKSDFLLEHFRKKYILLDNVFYVYDKPIMSSVVLLFEETQTFPDSVDDLHLDVSINNVMPHPDMPADCSYYFNLQYMQFEDSISIACDAILGEDCTESDELILYEENGFVGTVASRPMPDTISMLDTIEKNVPVANTIQELAIYSKIPQIKLQKNFQYVSLANRHKFSFLID